MTKDAVFVETLAVIRANDHQGVVERAGIPQVVEQLAQPIVQASDLRVVRIHQRGLLLVAKRLLAPVHRSPIRRLQSVRIRK